MREAWTSKLLMACDNRWRMIDKAYRRTGSTFRRSSMSSLWDQVLFALIVEVLLHWHSNVNSKVASKQSFSCPA